MKSILISKVDLKNLYLDKKLTTYDIAKFYDCSQGTIWKRLKEFNIKTRSSWNKVDLSKTKLRNLYIRNGLSTWQIERRLKISRGTIYRKLIDYNILVRNRAQSHIVYPRKNFNGNKTKKAYLIGFSMGDLRVRKIYKNSETIHTDCGSTKKVQINLISKLFKAYGRIWISKPNKVGATQIECFLNNSFNFLLRKRVLIDHWILNNKKYFAAFLAGFTDAEGCISITHKGLAFYSLGNYNSRLLSQIRNQLLKSGIESPKLTEGKTKGYIGKEGYANNQNYWSLRLNRKIHLLKLFVLIDPYLKHPTRIEGVKKAKENIKMRNKKYGNINMNSREYE